MTKYRDFPLVVSLFFRKFAAKTKRMKKDFQKSDVQTLCFYVSVSGKRIWVGECEAGYIYGGVGCFLFSRFLSHCFRFAPRFSTKDEAIKVAHLSVERGAPVPSIPAGILARVSESASKGQQKVNDLPFAL